VVFLNNCYDHWSLGLLLAVSTGSREGIAGRGCSSLKSVLTAVSSMVPEGLMRVTQEGLFFHVF